MRAWFGGLFVVLLCALPAQAQDIHLNCQTGNGTGFDSWRPASATNPCPVSTNGGGTIAADGSTTITSGGTAQNLFAGATPTNGWTIINPDATEDCWASDTTTAAANAVGSIRLQANGGGYETPPNRKSISAVSVVCATTGHKLTASRW